MEERIVKQMMTSVKCTSCGQKYQAQDIQILGCHQHLYFIQASCSACHTRYQITAVLKFGPNQEVTSDLTTTEMAEFQNSGSPNADDVLDMHSYLKHFDGDFAALFGYKKV
jgi:hypothetical protein